MSSKHKIVVAQRGWVYVSSVYRETDQLVCCCALNVRRWGTTAGLGELALNGPTDITVLDYYGRIEIHVLAIVNTIDCDDEVWTPIFAKYPPAKRSSR